jgi:hypothetical protein
MYWEWVKGRPSLIPNVAMLGMIALTQGHIPNYTVIDHLRYGKHGVPLAYRLPQMVTFEKRLHFFAIKPTTMLPI